MGHERHTLRSATEGRESPEPGLATDPLLDRAVVDRLRTDFDLALRRRLLDLFLGHAPGLVAALRDDVARADAEALLQGAHRLKGSCLNLGARRMSRLCHRLEQLASVGDLTAASGLLEELDGALDATRDELSARLVEP